MKTVLLSLMVPLALSACSDVRQPTVERQLLKDSCVSGDYHSCAKIGHMDHQDRRAAGDYTWAAQP